MERVQPVRAAVVAAVLGAVVVAAVYTARTVPDAVVGLLGGPTGLDRTGGLSVKYTSPTGETRLIELPGVAEEMAHDVVAALTSGLQLREALELPWAGEIARRGLPDGVELDIDYWRDENGHTYKVPYLHAPTRGQLERAVAGSPDASGIAYEQLDDGRWRTYLLAPEVAIDGSMIASALRSYDPNTYRPIVLLDLTRAGAERFCDATARLVGHKLAIVLGDRVRSAPVIMGRICGGRVAINTGGGDAQHREREADMIREVLVRGTVPAGGTVDAPRWQPAGDATTREWAGRGLLGLAAGLALGALVWLVVRVARPVRGAMFAGGGPFPVRRLAVTLLVPVAVFFGAYVVLPGINEEELAPLVGVVGPRGVDFSVLMLGITPLLSGFVLVEVVALAFRNLRHDPRRRLVLGRAAAGAGIVLALLQGYFLSHYIESLSRGGAEIVLDPGLHFRLVATLSLVAGTLLLAGLAGVVSTHGLGNGYGAVMVAGGLIHLAHRHTLPGVVAFAAIAIATAGALRWRIGEARLRVPSCALVPLSDAGGFAFAVLALGKLGLDGVLFEPTGWLRDLRANHWVVLALVLAFVPVWSWLLARPALVERVAMQAGAPRPTRAMWLRATLVSLLVLGAVAAVDLAVATSAVLAMITGAVALDIYADARAHRAKLAPAGVLHQIQRAGAIEQLLAGADIPCHIHASHLRTLFAFFGPWAPAIVLVPEEHAQRARELIAEATRPPTATLPPARLERRSAKSDPMS
jgi:SecD-like export protein